MTDLRTPEWHAGYEVGHREGESCNGADWTFALNEVLPDDLDIDTGDPREVAAYISRLLDGQARVEKLADQWNETPDYVFSIYDQGRVDQRHDMTGQLLEVLPEPQSSSRP